MRQGARPPCVRAEPAQASSRLHRASRCPLMSRPVTVEALPPSPALSSTMSSEQPRRLRVRLCDLHKNVRLWQHKYALSHHPSNARTTPCHGHAPPSNRLRLPLVPFLCHDPTSGSHSPLMSPTTLWVPRDLTPLSRSPNVPVERPSRNPSPQLNASDTRCLTQSESAQVLLHAGSPSAADIAQKQPPAALLKSFDAASDPCRPPAAALLLQTPRALGHTRRCPCRIPNPSRSPVRSSDHAQHGFEQSANAATCTSSQAPCRNAPKRGGIARHMAVFPLLAVRPRSSAFR